MDELAQVVQRIEPLLRRASGGPHPAVLAEMEATLSEGYARALMAEGHMNLLDRRLETLVETGDADELDSVARERRRLARHVTHLRERLAVLRDDFAALRQR